MPKIMISNDVAQATRDTIKQKMMDAATSGDNAAFISGFEELMQCVADEVRAEHEGLRRQGDVQVLAARGVRQLTSEEREYYQKLGDAMNSKDPKQALAGLDVVMPKTIEDSVFEDLRTNHPLLSRIQFTQTTGLTEFIYSEDGYQMAAWGKLCDEVVKELSAGFKRANMTLLSLAAFIPICKAMLKLGPEWLDRYIREILYEAEANGAEYGMVMGDGKDQPVGMIRQVGPGVNVIDGVYPEKDPIKVRDFSPKTMGNLVSMLAMGPNGKSRDPREIILLVNPQDYFQKVMPATTFNNPAGGYVRDVLPIAADIIRVGALPRGKAIIGLPYRYFFGVGSQPEDGTITHDDSYRFLERERVYLIELYANGFPKDNGAFLVLDISELQEAIWKVQQVQPAAPSDNADLTDLSLGSVALAPEFAADVTEYTAATTNAQNTVRATQAEAGAEVVVTVAAGGNTRTVENGSSVVWAEGENVVTITVTAPDGTTSKAYTVTVTKSS